MSLPPPPARRRKHVPRLPLSAFSPAAAAAADSFPIPPTPSLIAPSRIVDAHLRLAQDPSGAYSADIAHLVPAPNRAVVLSSAGLPAASTIDALQSLQSSLVDARVLAVLVPFPLDSTWVPAHLSAADRPPLALTTTYDGAPAVAPEAEEDSGAQAHVEIPVNNLRWALQHARAVDLDIRGDILATDSSFFDCLVNLLTKAIKSETNTRRTPVVLTSLLPPPLDSAAPAVTLMNHAAYTTYRQRVSLLSLFENVFVKLLPPLWLSAESNASLEPRREKDIRDILKLFIAPVLEAFGFERILFGSSPASADASAAPADIWYRLVLESYRELAVSQDEMDKIFVDNAERVYAWS